MKVIQERLTEELPLDFYERKTGIVAKDLLGNYLVHRSLEGITLGRIVETEAYLGQKDPACHSYRGLTPRCQSMFGPAGRVYMYQIYGVYYCFNITTDVKDVPAAVLIRALEPLEGIELMQKRRGKKNLKDLCSGPGKLSIAMGFKKELDGLSLSEKGVQVYRGELLAIEEIITTTRVGITKAADWPLRYYIKGNSFISKK